MAAESGCRLQCGTTGELLAVGSCGCCKLALSVQFAKGNWVRKGKGQGFVEVHFVNLRKVMNPIGDWAIPEPVEARAVEPRGRSNVDEGDNLQYRRRT